MMKRMKILNEIRLQKLKLLNKFISRLLDNQKITQGECFNLKSSDAHAPRLYGQPKVHKPDIPLRPIVSFIGSPTYALSKKIVNILAPLVGNTEFHVRDSSDFVESITNFEVVFPHWHQGRR